MPEARAPRNLTTLKKLKTSNLGKIELPNAYDFSNTSPPQNPLPCHALGLETSLPMVMIL
jgi:hypothetical protein